MGVYGADKACVPVKSYNMNGTSVIALLALPGIVSNRRLEGSIENQIGKDAFDSYRGGDGIHVIRRSCQTLPCFLVHFRAQLRPPHK
jgi:hypothetical protein